ncbi:unnamed protein product, partial [Mesorhabditis belari]|uniref:Galactokinase n=1 Tax=Mesorhabditis belari TaxID=2138241 RepID=A0AAF3FGN1_9BILA
MEAKFEEIYGVKPVYRVKCPGRVNLIGEHIDYNGYGVLPMAIELGTELLVAPINESKIEMRNVEIEKYDPFTMSLPSTWSGASPPNWFDYVLCGWRGILDSIQQADQQKGMLILMKGTIPPSSGLSSSSSLVCAAALSTLAIHTGHGFTEKYTREWLADLCAKAEQMIGTCGGGMDQASEILSPKGAALRIDFNPLKSKPVHLPNDALFVVLHSGDTLNKAASSHYNERVIECRIAAQILGKHLNLPEWTNFRKLKEVQDKSGKDLAELLELVESVVPVNPTVDEVIALIGKENLDALLSDNTRHMKEFKAQARAWHCYGEAKRVADFEEACKNGDLIAMGKLMNQSHDSLKERYDCSSPGLDKLVNECRKAGVLGARLTGAGWGGCAVVLVDKKHPTDLSHLHVLFESSPCEGITLEKF